MYIGRAVRYLRNAKEWKQCELAERSRISTSWMCKIEADQISPGRFTISRIADGLGCTSGDLLKFSEGMTMDAQKNLELFEQYFGGNK